MTTAERIAFIADPRCFGPVAEALLRTARRYIRVPCGECPDGYIIPVYGSKWILVEQHCVLCNRVMPEAEHRTRKEAILAALAAKRTDAVYFVVEEHLLRRRRRKRR